MLRPNTMVSTDVLSANMLLCCGEDPDEFLKALAHTGFGSPIAQHSYRCYRFWKFPRFTAAWTGIGSGCLEPMMWELLDDDSPCNSIILVGTAGVIGHHPGLCGQTYVVNAAFNGGVGVFLSNAYARPRWDTGALRLPRRETVSSDWYYCNSQRNDPRVDRARRLNAALREGTTAHWREGRLIEMETAQFYTLCNLLGSPDMRFVALKGVANLSDQHETQTLFSQQILVDAVKEAARLFE